MTDVEKNLAQLRERISDAALKSGRKPDDITLINVSKTVPYDRVMHAYEAGERDFGENRVQEFSEKCEKMPKDCRWHIIGRLQTNKLKYIINRVWLVHSLDRLELAKEFQKQLLKKDAFTDVLLQVNTAKESTKAGFLPEDIFDAAKAVSEYDRLRVRGIMTVAPFTDDKALLRRVFLKTREIYERVADMRLENFDMKYLSMGMSGDFELAIEAGANMVRVGSAVFGERVYN